MDLEHSVDPAYRAACKYMMNDSTLKMLRVTLFRMTDSAFTLKGQVGFVAFCRSGANMVDNGGAIKHFANSAT